MNEFNRIEKIKKLIPKLSSNIIVGIGDDAAVLKKNNNTYQLVTCDSLVENVHFVKENITPSDLGQKAVTANASDIAAMGGTPKHMLVSIIIPKNIEDSFIKNLYLGISAACKKYNIDVIGGNMSSGPVIIIDITMLGEVKKTNVILRSGANVSDAVLVTGTLGNAPKIPTARIFESKILSKTGKVTAMIDLSDGLSMDIRHICTQSNVGVRLYENKIPIQLPTPGVNAQKNSWKVALNRGEDYELCFTTRKSDAERLKKLVEQKTKTPVTIIGEITQSGMTLVMPNGQEVPLPKGGWDHFI